MHFATNLKNAYSDNPKYRRVYEFLSYEFELKPYYKFLEFLRETSDSEIKIVEELYGETKRVFDLLEIIVGFKGSWKVCLGEIFTDERKLLDFVRSSTINIENDNQPFLTLSEFIRDVKNEFISRIKSDLLYH